MSSKVSDPRALSFIGPPIAFFAFILAVVGSFRCDFVSIDMTLDSKSDYMGFGIWYYQGWSYFSESGTIYYSRSCFSYADNVAMDAYWKTAEAFSIIAAVLGGLACVASCISPCVDGCVGNKVIALSFMFTALCQGLCLLFLKSTACRNNPIVDNFPDLDFASVNCNLSWGGNCIIAATVLWFVAGAAMCCVVRQEDKAQDDDMEPEVDETEVSQEPAEKDAAVTEE